MDGDAEQPGGKAGFRPERGQTAKGTDKGLLRGILNVLRIGEIAAAQGADALFMTAHELVKCAFIALLKTVDQFLVRLHRPSCHVLHWLI
ncbi:MAG: hypothetical protein BWY83_03153 [bacterium ADurb.Bin478]|nr:MAG: hypothetical protein BWY83_03153 [bacterium ADurb.Bin478]